MCCYRSYYDLIEHSCWLGTIEYQMRGAQSSNSWEMVKAEHQKGVYHDKRLEEYNGELFNIKFQVRTAY